MPLEVKLMLPVETYDVAVKLQRQLGLSKDTLFAQAIHELDWNVNYAETVRVVLRENRVSASATVAPSVDPGESPRTGSKAS